MLNWSGLKKILGGFFFANLALEEINQYSMQSPSSKFIKLPLFFSLNSGKSCADFHLCHGGLLFSIWFSRVESPRHCTFNFCISKISKTCDCFPTISPKRAKKCWKSCADFHLCHGGLLSSIWFSLSRIVTPLHISAYQKFPKRVIAFRQFSQNKLRSAELAIQYNNEMPHYHCCGALIAQRWTISLLKNHMKVLLDSYITRQAFTSFTWEI